jgi:hypothetical protein
MKDYCSQFMNQMLATVRAGGVLGFVVPVIAGVTSPLRAVYSFKFRRKLLYLT